MYIFERTNDLKDKEAVTCARKKTSIGGQALIEGIMMRGPKNVAMAVRHTSGQMRVKEWDTSNKKVPMIFKIPIIRGVYNFCVSMKLGYKCLMESAEMSGLDDELNEKKTDVAESESCDSDACKENNDSEACSPKNGCEESTKGDPVVIKADEKKKSSALMNVIMVIASVLGVALALFLFMFLPAQLFAWLIKAFPSLDNRLIRSIFEGVLRIVIFVLYMLLVSLMKDIRRTFMYHGAEHKTIFCYEAGLELTVENVRKMKRFHPRCGTSFMMLMLLVGIIISMFITIEQPLLRSCVKLLLLPIAMGVGYELIKIAGRHDNIITKIISAPGVWLQHVSVLEPDDSMIECAIEAVKLVIPDDNSDRW